MSAMLLEVSLLGSIAVGGVGDGTRTVYHVSRQLKALDSSQALVGSDKNRVAVDSVLQPDSKPRHTRYTSVQTHLLRTYLQFWGS